MAQAVDEALSRARAVQLGASQSSLDGLQQTAALSGSGNEALTVLQVGVVDGGQVINIRARHVIYTPVVILTPTPSHLQ